MLADDDDLTVPVDLQGEPVHVDQGPVGLLGVARRLAALTGARGAHVQQGAELDVHQAEVAAGDLKDHLAHAGGQGSVGLLEHLAGLDAGDAVGFLALQGPDRGLDDLEGLGV